MDYSGYESESKGKRKQHCTYCKNHGKKSRKTNHKCDHENCECLLCKLTRLSRLIMRHQQRLWRHLKDTKRRENADTGGGAAGTASAAANGLDANANTVGSTKQQKCDMCRNHGDITSKRAHKNQCPFQNCKCPLCNLTRKRRDIMRHQQRVRRSQVMSKQHNEAWQYVIQAELEFLNFSPSTIATSTANGHHIANAIASIASDDNIPSSSSASTSPSPISSSSISGPPTTFKSEVISSGPVSPTTPISMNNNKHMASVTPEIPPLEPLPECSPRRYSPRPPGHTPDTITLPIAPSTPPEEVQPSMNVKDINTIDSDYPWRNLKRERDDVFKFSPKIPTREENLLGNLDFMRGPQTIGGGRFDHPVPMEGITFHDSINHLDLGGTNHTSPFKSLMPIMDAARLPPPPPTPLKKSRTEESLNLQYNTMLWGTIPPVEPRVSFSPEELQQQFYRRSITGSSTDLRDLRMQSPPELLPITQHHHPLRPRPLAPYRPHTLPPTMGWEQLKMHYRYLACFLQNRTQYTDSMPMMGPFGLTREPSFLHPSVP